jgi:prepilin-type N-terminal cleavage/methylation domain-containing protein
MARTSQHSSCCPDSPGEHGFTLVEVLVAIFVLLVGVLGVVSLVDGANAVTSKTRAREGGTNVARTIIEVSRSVRYRDLTAAELLDQLASRPGLADAKPAAGYTIRSRNVDYEVTLTVCSIDDPQDNLGAHTGPTTFCSDSDALPAGQTSGSDRNPDDYKRVRVTLNWTTRNVGQSITQTSAIINPVGGLGPSITSLTMTSPSSNSDPLLITSPLVHKADFLATTSTSAEGVTWSVGGEPQGSAAGSGLSWTFSWDLDEPNGQVIYHDCTSVVQADAFDDQDRSGAPRAVTVVLNRHAPVASTGFGGGRNGTGDYVDLRWLPSPECDIRGYRVYRSLTSGQLGSPITCLNEAADVTTELNCTDQAPNGSTYYYTVVGLDLPPGGGAPREGAPSAQVTVGAATAKPPAPANVTLCIGDGSASCLDAEGLPAPTGALVVGWDPSSDPNGIQFYRIYRDGTGYANRYDTYFPDATNPGFAWFEFDMSNPPHTYRVSAVDGSFAESDLSGPVTGG